ncbi:DUF72 domain-containing protein [Paenibacillus sp. HB172176]|uniref:DUF72 domain-containing protein n=1 Tax=Paenibacillus sp. HB172176 TaxID=2493690 RepID=UPI00143A5965|nr:DUF72 domain-containing protein [Paenibacillus sp. HB172176]
MTIHIGLAGWGDHDSLYPRGTKAGDKLKVYAEHFRTVEVDSTFYAIQSQERFAAWVGSTPDTLHFVVKAYQGMTGHQRGDAPGDQELDAMTAAFCRMLEPAREAGRLTAALFQYPPWFDCTSGNVLLLREMKRRMSGFPCALEFRHQSWFEGGMREKTLAFMQKEGWIHSICDEPQAGVGSVPTVLAPTDKEATIVRMHGRNESGWNSGGKPNWREVRYLYRYSEDELREWADKLTQLERLSGTVSVIFNNNSGGDAADNAKQLMRLLGLKRPDGEEPKVGRADDEPPDVEQLELF